MGDDSQIGPLSHHYSLGSEGTLVTNSAKTEDLDAARSLSGSIRSEGNDVVTVSMDGFFFTSFVLMSANRKSTTHQDRSTMNDQC